MRTTHGTLCSNCIYLKGVRGRGWDHSSSRWNQGVWILDETEETSDNTSRHVRTSLEILFLIRKNDSVKCLRWSCRPYEVLRQRRQLHIREKGSQLWFTWIDENEGVITDHGDRKLRTHVSAHGYFWMHLHSHDCSCVSVCVSVRVCDSWHTACWNENVTHEQLKSRFVFIFQTVLFLFTPAATSFTAPLI